MNFETKVPLSGSDRAPVQHATIAQPVDRNEIVSATIVLRPRAETAAPEAYAFGVTGANSHHDRVEFGVAHGAAPSCMESVKEFAHEYGLAVAEASQQRRSVVVTGPAESIERAFDSQLAYYD